ncbi:DNA-directed RNA polymerase I subunit RPA43 isoform X2 [Choloepus didactylus]|uniref:DNA-directed RNA polymerase I subunit RPA43 isoform X2 n=1 Tax=Choloepus didactylus TaxID=27675 RepID=UPI0018A0E770|nr:DNA-directed RNA polymerase I subunit RPA43 isoform X2 [Choloepus didactylus]
MAAGCSEAPRPKVASEETPVGPAGILPCLELPTYEVACALVSSRYSCLLAGPHRRHIALSPRYLNRKRTGIREQLDAELLRYSESLLGVPIAYDNIKVVCELGDIYDDQGHIHLNIEADFVIFCPEPGQKLMGTVNKLSSSHIGCLVHGCFNASIPKPEQMLAEQWQTLEINVGDELEFEVFRLDSDAAGVFCIRGKLNITSLQSKCSEVSKEVTETSTEEAVEKPPKKKKKKKKDPETYEVEDSTTELVDIAENTIKEETDLQTHNNVDGLWRDEPKKKKKKKKYQDGQDQDPVFQGSDSSGYQSDHKKKKKKRKHNEVAEVTTVLENSPKKKREKTP